MARCENWKRLSEAYTLPVPVDAKGRTIRKAKLSETCQCGKCGAEHQTKHMSIVAAPQLGPRRAQIRCVGCA